MTRDRDMDTSKDADRDIGKFMDRDTFEKGQVLACHFSKEFVPCNSRRHVSQVAHASRTLPIFFGS